MEEKEFLKDAIKKMIAVAPVEGESGWRVFEETKSKLTSELDTRASGLLNSFDVVPDQYRKGLFELAPKRPTGPEVCLMAYYLWCRVEGDKSPVLATSVIAAACVEFARSQFDSALTGIVFGLDKSVRAWVVDEAKRIPEIMIERQWCDADSIARAPRSVTWFRESAGDNFDEWLYRCGERLDHQMREPIASMEPKPEEASLRAAMALVWLDEALLDPDRSLELMALAVNAASCNGFIIGWKCSEEYAAEEGRSFAKKGADARHTANRARKEEIVAAYKAGEWKSKDQAASVLALQYSIGWRTIREYLKGN